MRHFKKLTTAQEFIKRGYNESTRNLNFQVGCEDLKDLIKCIQIIKEYNDFDAVLINDLLVNLERTEGITLKEFRIGRENSPVIYIKGRGVNFENELIAFAQCAKADECNFTRSILGTECRLWWD